MLNDKETSSEAKMTKTQVQTHTPTPWFQGQIKGTEHTIFNTDCGVFIEDEEASQDDIAHIVRCVNAHEELVKALELAAMALEELSQHKAFEGEAPEFNDGGVGYVALWTAQQALDHAKGESHE